MSKLTLTNITSGYGTTTAFNANNNAIVAAIENTLSRDGTSPNQMAADLDMNGYRVINVLAQSGDGFIWKGPWVSGTVYALNNIVSNSGSSYICKTAHTAGALFATDLAAIKWEVISAKGDSGAGSGDMIAANNLSELTATKVTARGNISAAASGANTDITSLSAPALGAATATTQAPGDNTTKVATTAFVTGDIATAIAPLALKRLAQIVTYTTGTVATGTTILPMDNTIPQNTEGNQYMTLAITPTNASSTLEIDVEVNVSHGASCTIGAMLFQDSVANALGGQCQAQHFAAENQNIKFKHMMAAGTTSATTFKVRCGGGTPGTTTLNGISGGQYFNGIMSSRITIKEWLP